MNFHVTRNSLWVSGPEENLEAFAAHMNRPVRLRMHTVTANPVFSLHNIIAPTPEQMAAYWSPCDCERPSVALCNPKTSNRSFHWNQRNWGCRIDVAYIPGSYYPNVPPKLSIEDDGSLMYCFESYGGVPFIPVRHIAQEFRSLTFEYAWECKDPTHAGEATFEHGLLMACGELPIC